MMPNVTEQHKKLQVLAGTWVGEEMIQPSPWDQQGGAAKSRTNGRVDLDGFYVITDYEQERGGKVVFRGHGVYGYDENAKCYTMHWFDSMGGGGISPPARGKWEGNTLTFEHSGAMGQGRYVYTFEGETRHTFRIENTQDGRTWKTFLEGKYTRK